MTLVLRGLWTFCWVLIAAVGLAPPAFANDGSPRDHQHTLMANVSSWGYQLQRLDLAALAASPFDLLVIDHAPDRVESVELLFTRAEVATLKRKPDGSRRLVLAYLSIGEAERYRFYWDEAWLQAGTCPTWIGPVNPQWVGNYPVDFWRSEWQALIFGRSDSYVDRVMDAGFDGLYLDRADVYEQFKARPTAKAEMVGFISKLADHARTLNKDAIVVLQNAEELLRQKDIRVRLDGVAKESHYFNADQGSKPTQDDDQKAASANLRLLQKAGGRVLIVEYSEDAAKARQARVQAAKDGFLLHVTERTLSTLSLNGPDQPRPVASLAAAPIAADPQPVRARPCG